MNIDYKAAGKMMGSYRRKEKISQKELAKAVGISNNYLSNILISKTGIPYRAWKPLRS